MGDPRIHCRVRGGPTQGWGNVYRLASVAEQVQARLGGSITFLAEGPPTVRGYLARRGFEVVALAEDLPLDAEARVLAGLEAPDLTLVEMLDVTLERQAVLAARGGALAVFDDLCDHVYDADLVVCGQDLPSFANRALSAPRTRFLVGYDYFLARPEFVARRATPAVVGARIETVLVTLGGGKYDVGYLKAAAALDDFETRVGHGVRATFVLGHAAEAELGAELKSRRPGSVVLGGVSDLDRLMAEHDLVIASAGYTKLEAALVGRPQVMLAAQWHQIPLAQTFAARTGVPNLGYLAYAEPDQIAAALLALDPEAARRSQIDAARAVVDGRGMQRVVDALAELVKGDGTCRVGVA
ncbi:MAG: hypothetical protein AAFZ65_17890 [Planctomycetota bacterium]